jgi:hypothetical protein
LSAFAALLALSISQLPAQESHTLARSTKPSLHCLWKVQGDSNVVYLLGSIHLLRESDYPLPQVMNSAFTNSQIAVFEMDIDKANDPAASISLLSKATLPDGKTLRDVLPTKVYNSFSNHAVEAGLPEMLYETLKPGMAIMMLDAMNLVKLGANPEYGEDEHFFKLAKDSDRKIIALETLDFQLGLMLSFEGPDEEIYLEKSLEEMDNEKKEYNEMVGAWKTGDAAALEKMLNEMRTDATAVFKKLVSDRTASWVPKVDELLHGSENAIIIVGAGHLVGPDGLVELLKKQGFKVTQF